MEVNLNSKFPSSAVFVVNLAAEVPIGLEYNHVHQFCVVVVVVGKARASRRGSSWTSHVVDRAVKEMQHMYGLQLSDSDSLHQL